MRLYGGAVAQTELLKTDTAKGMKEDEAGLMKSKCRGVRHSSAPEAL